MVSPRFKVIMVLIALANVIIFYSKYILKKNGYKVRFFDTFSDIFYMFNLAKKTEDSFLKRKYYILALAQPVIFLAFVFLVMDWE